MAESIDDVADRLAEMAGNYAYLKFQAALLCRRLIKDDVVSGPMLAQTEHVLAHSS